MGTLRPHASGPAAQQPSSGAAGARGGPPLLVDVLRGVSRSFYSTLRVLPQAVRAQIGLAYLLARSTDTVADTELLPVAERRAGLAAMLEDVQGRSRRRFDPSPFLEPATHSNERALLGRWGDAVEALEGLAAEDRAMIREVLSVIVSGQDLDLARFEHAVAGRVIALESREDLDDYTFRVAGCVGEFWTRMCRARVFPRARLDEGEFLERGVRFGKGLQLINILRDLAGDLRQGRCYLPRVELESAGIAPEALLDAANEHRVRPVYDAWLSTAVAHLAAGWEYTQMVPFGQMRVRLACAWPVLIGLATARKLREGRVLSPESRIKISRGEMRDILLRSVLYYPWPGLWRRLWDAPPPSF